MRILYLSSSPVVALADAAGWGTHIRETVQHQLETLPHVMLGGLVHEQVLTLARRLCDLLPENLTRVFFSDSGSVAVEVAMKMAVQYWLNKGVRGRTKMLAFKGGYHGVYKALDGTAIGELKFTKNLHDIITMVAVKPS